MDTAEAAHSDEGEALAYPDGEVPAWTDEVLLGDGTLDEAEDCHRTWQHRDLLVRRSELVVADTNNLVGEDHGAEVDRKKDRNASVVGEVDSIHLVPE